MGSSTLCTAKASYKKQPGVLQLTATHLLWTQDSRTNPSVYVPHAHAASLFCSKEGAAQVKLKLGVVNDDAGHNFTFLAPLATASVDRENFKRELTQIISRNRSGTNGQSPRPSSSAPLPAAQNVATLRTSAAPKDASGVSSVSQSNRNSATPSFNITEDYRLHRKVLHKYPELAQLHKELVLSGQITESEFWEGREPLLHAEAASEAQQRGKAGQLVDIRPQTVDGGEIKMVITPQLVHDIFEEYPVVAQVYNDNVPSNLSEEEFWKRYLQSKLYHSHRASIRSVATQHVVNADPIFDHYLERADDELEPRRQRDEVVESLIDLVSTSEDHIKTGNDVDVTMRAGSQRGALPLIRRFNEHSERLLNTALGDGPATKRRRLDEGDINSFYYSQIDLEDLRDLEASCGIQLNMQDRDRYFDGHSTTGNQDDGLASTDTLSAVSNTKVQLLNWSSRLSELKVGRKAADAALITMTENVASRLEVKVRKNDIPDSFFRQMTTCQTAANEFLRQFWLSVFPPPVELQTQGTSTTPSQKAAKTAKMYSYLSKTHEKVDSLVHRASVEGVDPNRVRTAMQPIMDAVNKALVFYNSRSRTSSDS